MIDIGGYVIYGSMGICKVESLSLLKFHGSTDKQQYYTLVPRYHKDSKVYVPADNKDLVERMRPILSQNEIDRIILSAKDASISWEPNHKTRADQFHAILLRRDERELLLLISCLYLRSKQSEKGLTAGDARILKAAEDIIQEEFAFSLHIPTQEVGNYIKNKLGLCQ